MKHRKNVHMVNDSVFSPITPPVGGAGTKTVITAPAAGNKMIRSGSNNCCHESTKQ